MNTFGRNFRVSVFGESHGPMVGVTIDGVPASLPLGEADFAIDLEGRRSGLPGTTSRREKDIPHIVSGVYQGFTTGAPLTIVFNNEDVQEDPSVDYTILPRPGHADFTAAEKWDGFNDPRSGGHLSGRLTLPVVAAGVVAKRCTGCMIDSEVIAIGGSEDPSAWEALTAEAAAEGDSLGGVVQCTVGNVPTGLGEPFWDSVESLISHAVFAIPGVRGIEFGDGFAAAAMRGSQHNDPFVMAADGEYVTTARNGSGGINGGITNGAQIVFRVAFKPASSIAAPQRTLNLSTGLMQELRCDGRNDVCFVPRTPAVVSAMTAIVLADLELSL